jgi:Ni,Fe-hydrogenase maturation factor
MPLLNKKSGTIHSVSEREIDKIKKHYDNNFISMVADTPDDSPHLAAIIYQLKLLQEDIEELRRFCGTEEKGRIDDNAKAITEQGKTIKAQGETIKKILEQLERK